MTPTTPTHTPPDMTVCLLVGGLGTRVAHLTGGHPKCYMTVAGHRWLDVVVEGLEAGGIRHIVLAHAPLGTGGAVKSMLGILPTTGFWVLNGDTWLPKCQYPQATQPTMLVYPRWSNTWVEASRVIGYQKTSTRGTHTDCGGWYTPDLWDDTPPPPVPFDMEVIIHKAITRGLKAHPLQLRPHEVGSPEGIRRVEVHFGSPH